LKLLLSIFGLLLKFLIGAAIITYLENLPYLESLYVSIVTNGAGNNLQPKSQPQKIFQIFFLPIGTMITAASLGSFADIFIQRAQIKAAQQILRNKFTEETILDMDADGDGKVNEQEYVEAMVIKLGKISKQELNDIKQRFKDLDTDKSGWLDAGDL